MLYEGVIKIEKIEIHANFLPKHNNEVSERLFRKYSEKCKISARYIAAEEVSLLIAIKDRSIGEVNIDDLIKDYFEEMSIYPKTSDIQEISNEEFRMKNINDGEYTYKFANISPYVEINNKWEDWRDFAYLGYIPAIFEEIVSNTKEFDIGLYASSFAKEKELIEKNNNSSFIGHPVHYSINCKDITIANKIVKSIIQTLNISKRLSYCYFRKS
jgi:hypothetical protein